MQRTLRTIRIAIRATSASLVFASACCTDTELAADGGPAEQGDASILAAFPLSALTCTGPVYGNDDGGMGGYFGQCCAKMMCYTPDAGPCESVEVVSNDRFFFGSGDCNCGDIRGPFAPPDDAGSASGECCYVVPIIGCTGRPLSTDKGHLLAPVVSSTEWIV